MKQIIKRTLIISTYMLFTIAVVVFILKSCSAQDYSSQDGNKPFKVRVESKDNKLGLWGVDYKTMNILSK
jgi:hypothetical protein